MSAAATGGGPIRVLVAAAQPIVRAGLETLVASSPALLVVGTAPGVVGDALEKAIETLHPDVVLLELDVSDGDPPARLLDGDESAPVLVVLADDPHGTWATEALRAGVRAVLPREVGAAEIVAAIDGAAAGLIVLHPGALAMLLPLLPAPARIASTSSPTPSVTLTPREVEVLGMMAEGLGNKTIAYKLGISEHTVKFHIGSIFSKLGAASRTEAVTVGARQGLIML